MRSLVDLERQSGEAAPDATPAPGKSTLSQRLYRKGERAPAAPDAALGMLGGGAGAALPDAARGRFEDSLSTDLGAVRVHTGADSAAAADALGARAFTVGSDVHFAAGEYQPNDPFGLHLLAHEVAHTVQQSSDAAGPAAAAPQAKLEVSQPGDRLEVEADRAADAMVSGAAASVSVGAALAIQRDPRDGRGENPVPPPGTSTTPSFSDMGRDDHGPVIRHDHGHMEGPDGNFDPSLHQDPTWSDRWELAKWITKLEGAELLRPDLVDGTSAYRHFLFGNGATRDIRYPRFIANDAAGARVLESAMSDARDAAVRRHDEDVAGATVTPGTRSYHIRTGVIPVGSGSDPRYPYPATENWQKAIGAHSIWIEANVTVTVRAPEGTPPNSCPAGGYERSFHVEMTIHAEDMYNFNPGAADIATGTPDSANGRFEITGLGHEYLNTGTYARNFDFVTTMAPAPPPGTAGSGEVTPGRAPREGRAEGSRGRAAER